MRSLLLFVALLVAQTSVAQDLEELQEGLKSGDRNERREAAFQLRELGAKAQPALPSLIEALDDEDEQVAARVVTAIARIGPDAADAIPALIKGLDPERRRYDEQVVFRTAYALSQIGTPAVAPLREALKSSSSHRRSGAAQALQLIGEPSAPAVPELIVAIHDDESEVSRAAAEALAAIGDRALGPLREDLKKSPTIAGVRAIGSMGAAAAGAKEQLLGMLGADSGEADLRAAIIEALGAIEVPFESLEAPLLTALKSDAEVERRAAANVLLTYPDPSKHSLSSLKSWMASGDSLVRVRSAWVVGQFGSDAAGLAPDLIALLEIGEEQEAITSALAGLGPGASGAILKAVESTPIAELKDPEKPHWARTALKAYGPLAMPALEKALASESVQSRFVALDALGSLGKIAQPLVPVFRRATNDAEPAVRLAALNALDLTGADGTRLTTILHRRCSDPAAEVRAVAIRMLGQHGGNDRQAFGLVDKALSDKDPAVRLAAIVSLENFGAEAEASIPQLLELAGGAETETRLAILKVLRSVGSAGSEALPFVREMLDSSDPAVRGAAVTALVAIAPGGDDLTEVLAGMLADKEEVVRHAAIEGLGRRGEAAIPVAPQLFALLETESDRDKILEALRRIRSRDVDLYVGALKSSEPRVRLFACEALGRLGKDAEKAIPQLEEAKKDRYDFVRRRAQDAIRRIRG